MEIELHLLVYAYSYYFIYIYSNNTLSFIIYHKLERGDSCTEIMKPLM